MHPTATQKTDIHIYVSGQRTTQRAVLPQFPRYVHRTCCLACAGRTRVQMCSPQLPCTSIFPDKAYLWPKTVLSSCYSLHSMAFAKISFLGFHLNIKQHAMSQITSVMFHHVCVIANCSISIRTNNNHSSLTEILIIGQIKFR